MNYIGYSKQKATASFDVVASFYGCLYHNDCLNNKKRNHMNNNIINLLKRDIAFYTSDVLLFFNNLNL